MTLVREVLPTFVLAGVLAFARAGDAQLFEAETAQLSGIGPYDDGGGIHEYPRVEDIHTSGYGGYTGDGYVNLAYSDDSTITWDNVVQGQAGDYTLAFRYSMTDQYTGIFIPARPMGLMVNDTVITRAVDFRNTTGWDVWGTLPVTVRLNEGVNTIALFATDLAATGANPHLDNITITPVPPGVVPAAPTNLAARAGVGDVDLSWTPSAFASSYNVYRSTSSGTEDLLASGVTASYFFDTGLASDGTSYFYVVSSVNSAGESDRAREVSATPVAPNGLLFRDDFSEGPSSGWTLAPDGYWLPQVGLLTDAKGDTVASVPQTATIGLPSGVVAWQTDLLSKAGNGAAIDTRGNHGMAGLVAQSSDGLNAVSFSISDGSALNLRTTIDGVPQALTRVGTAPRGSRGEPIWHTYQIRLDADGTFSLLLDGNVLTRNISAGPASAWAGGIATGTLFTLADLDERHLSTYLDNVRAFGSL